jgi:hypothetical protein
MGLLNLRSCIGIKTQVRNSSSNFLEVIFHRDFIVLTGVY